MSVLISGASGFIGSRLLSDCLADQLDVLALVRSNRPFSCRTLVNDLADPTPLDLRDMGIETIVHLAAAMSGDAEAHHQLTVLGTRKMLAAARQAGIRRVVALSSLAVIDHRTLHAAQMPTPEAKRVAAGHGVGPYARSKAEQELDLIAFGLEDGQSSVVLRPGLVHEGPALSAAYANLQIGPLRIGVSHSGTVPLTSLQTLSIAIREAIRNTSPGVRLCHVLDDSLPTQGQYAESLVQRGVCSRPALSVNWRLLRPLAALGQAMSRTVPVPEALTTLGFATRFTPYRWHPGMQCRTIEK